MRRLNMNLYVESELKCVKKIIYIKDLTTYLPRIVNLVGTLLGWKGMRELDTVHGYKKPLQTQLELADCWISRVIYGFI